ncbi:hypothetical protein F4825DRAFT_216807 [Nemania diffusa]|nr:hypothetical protein F4825DRAFT_216807 [Nemania diffusa]
MTSQSMGSSSKQSMGNFFQTSAPLQPYDKGSKIHACIECGDAIPAKELAKLECGHRWCRKCLKKRFKASIKDTQNRPPTCCTSEIIPLKHVSHIFDDGFKESWNDKFGMNRNYCPRPKCREWIQQEDHRHHSNGRTSATCRKCNTRICGVCYNKWHEAKHCPTDRDATQFMNRAKDAGWKRCFNCQALVESKEGYNHTVCPCGAQFCMACGSEWGGCRCPLYNNHVDEDELSHAPAPMVSRERLGGTDGLPRSQRPGFSYAPESQHHRGHPDEDRARRAQHAAAAAAAAAAADDDEDDDDDDDDYLNDMGDVAGIGNTPGHFMSDYRRRSHVTVPPVSLPTAPLPPASVQLERSKSGANYVSGVNKARGVRGPSMERLADRFSEQRQTFNPNHRPFGPPMAPFTTPPLGMGPLPHQPPMPPSPISRRHTMDDDKYGIPFDPRYAQHSLSRRATTHPFMDDFAVHPPMGRRRYRQMEPPRPSELAGLTGPGSGMNRVFEWMNHVDPYLPDNQTVA